MVHELPFYQETCLWNVMRLLAVAKLQYSDDVNAYHLLNVVDTELPNDVGVNRTLILSLLFNPDSVYLIPSVNDKLLTLGLPSTQTDAGSDVHISSRVAIFSPVNNLCDGCSSRSTRVCLAHLRS